MGIVRIILFAQNMTQLVAKVIVVKTNFLQIGKELKLTDRLPLLFLIVHGTYLAEVAVTNLQSPTK